MVEQFSFIEDFAVVMAVAGASLLLFRFLRLPLVLGYLVAGVLVGPYSFSYPSVQNPEVIRLLADMGLVLLLFATGLEFGWHRLRELGFRVMLIGVLGVLLMLAIGYELGEFLGWTGTEAVFLGAALAITSSAILAKVLAGTGQLSTLHGQIIIGVSIVEDLAAVVLLSVLSGLTSAGALDIGNLGTIVIKLGVFSASALVLSSLVAPRLLNLVAPTKEALLIISLALCFGLALVAHRLGISPAAGAFLIGAVIGDTRHSKTLLSTMDPIKDLFAALFFVSIGMLVDIRLFTDFAVPALIVTGVFIAGKVVTATVATFLAGYTDRTPIRVGMGMPQVGEFSLAMAKVGNESAAVGALFYPVIAATTALTALAYPFIVRSSDTVAAWLERSSPRLLRQYASSLGGWLRTLYNASSSSTEVGKRLRGAGTALLVNVGVIMVLLAIGAVLVGFSSHLGRLIGMGQQLVGIVISAGILALCVPSFISVWRSLRKLGDALSDFTEQYLPNRLRRNDARLIRLAFRDALLVLVLVLLVVWSLPFILQIVQFGTVGAPILIVPMIVLAALFIRSAIKLHRELENIVSQTFLGNNNDSNAPTPSVDPQARAQERVD
jgi:CPA2 family monovalent cation:H+ antiporter-2